VCCSVLQCVAVCCSVLQCVAVCCAPQAGTGDSMSRYRRSHCSAVINYDSYFLVGEQFALNCYLRPRSWDYCQIFKTTYLFLLIAGLFPFSLSEMLWDTYISKYLHKDSNLEVSSNRGNQKNFSASWHITHISMAISADTDHNSTKLVCDHPLE